MATTPQPGTDPTPGDRKDDLDREVERRAEHVMEEESDPLKPAEEEREQKDVGTTH